VRDVPGKIDVVLVHPANNVELMPLARDAVAKGAGAFWIEIGLLASPEVEQVLANGKVPLIEYEDFETEYLKHIPPLAPPLKREKKPVKVYERMTRNPVTATAGEALKDALAKMERGKFRHLPVVDDDGKLTAILSDRDIRLIRPSLAFVDKEDAPSSSGPLP
jgi:CBS-domain-containing membrane protein